MRNYIALLRGINVSGHRLIKMADLKRMFEAMGFGRVQTYIQSGNVLFASDDEAGPLSQRLEAEIMRVFGFDVPVILRTPAEMERIVENSPFPEMAEGESLYVSLLTEAPSPEGIERLSAYKGNDEFRVVGLEVYVLYRAPVNQSKLANNLHRLGVPSTSRNWQTMNKLVALGKSMES
jgi:uncharacterized protein (DUF1697 family)